MDKPSLQDKDFLTVIETAELFGLSRRKMIPSYKPKRSSLYG